MVILDFSKAFDVIPHRSLLGKLIAGTSRHKWHGLSVPPNFPVFLPTSLDLEGQNYGVTTYREEACCRAVAPPPPATKRAGTFTPLGIPCIHVCPHRATKFCMVIKLGDRSFTVSTTWGGVSFKKNCSANADVLSVSDS